MPNYRRFYLPGGTFFLTLVTYNRTPLFSDSENVSRLRNAVAAVKSEQPFEILGAVVLPDTSIFCGNYLLMILPIPSVWDG